MARVDGSFGSGGQFDGAVTLRTFDVSGGRLVAVGTVDGTLTDAAGEEVGELRDEAVRLPLQAGSLAASCDVMSARLGPVTVTAAGQRVEIAPVELEIAARASRGEGLREQLCDLAKRVADGEAPAALARALDRVLAAL
jgi:hypothetical protein